MKINRFLSFCFGICFIVAMLLSSVSSVVFDHGFYQDLYTRINLAKRENITQSDLENSIFMMTDYVEGKREDLNGTITWRGQQQPTFNAKEIRHMKDVRTLWQNARRVMIFCWLMVLFCAGILLAKRRLAGLNDLVQGLLDGLLFFAIVLVFFGFWWLIDFTGFWTWFHTVVFPGNSDWLLDPATDFMIVICPEEMFSSMVFLIAGKLLAGLAAVGGFGWLIHQTLPVLLSVETDCQTKNLQAETNPD